MPKENLDLSPWKTSHVWVGNGAFANRYAPEDAIQALRDLDSNPQAELVVVYLDHEGNEQPGRTYRNTVDPYASAAE